MLKMKDVWQAFLMFCIRFWDGRSQPEQNEIIYLMKLESERNHQILNRMLEVIAAKDVPVQVDEPVELPKPIGTRNWKAEAARLSRESVERRKQLEAEYQEAQKNKTLVNVEATKSIEAPEEELGVNQ